MPLPCAAVSTRKPLYRKAVEPDCPVQQGVLGALVVLGGLGLLGSWRYCGGSVLLAELMLLGVDWCY